MFPFAFRLPSVLFNTMGDMYESASSTAVKTVLTHMWDGDEPQVEMHPSLFDYEKVPAAQNIPESTLEKPAKVAPAPQTSATTGSSQAKTNIKTKRNKCVKQDDKSDGDIVVKKSSVVFSRKSKVGAKLSGEIRPRKKKDRRAQRSGKIAGKVLLGMLLCVACSAGFVGFGILGVPRIKDYIEDWRAGEIESGGEGAAIADTANYVVPAGHTIPAKATSGDNANGSSTPTNANPSPKTNSSEKAEKLFGRSSKIGASLQTASIPRKTDAVTKPVSTTTTATDKEASPKPTAEQEASPKPTTNKNPVPKATTDAPAVPIVAASTEEATTVAAAVPSVAASTETPSTSDPIPTSGYKSGESVSPDPPAPEGYVYTPSLALAERAYDFNSIKSSGDCVDLRDGKLSASHPPSHKPASVSHDTTVLELVSSILSTPSANSPNYSVAQTREQYGDLLAYLDCPDRARLLHEYATMVLNVHPIIPAPSTSSPAPHELLQCLAHQILGTETKAEELKEFCQACVVDDLQLEATAKNDWNQLVQRGATHSATPVETDKNVCRIIARNSENVFVIVDATGREEEGNKISIITGIGATKKLKGQQYSVTQDAQMCFIRVRPDGYDSYYSPGKNDVRMLLQDVVYNIEEYRDKGDSASVRSSVDVGKTP
eukprot:GHVT01062727.1.p1 GENE.GHVT01062727.1~~GHVT01062727.1.p1  ORF type:complete len:658 (+),score=89.05 GHVT01062727.1:425-2398(+)